MTKNIKQEIECDSMSIWRDIKQQDWPDRDSGGIIFDRLSFPFLELGLWKTKLSLILAHAAWPVYNLNNTFEVLFFHICSICR